SRPAGDADHTAVHEVDPGRRGERTGAVQLRVTGPEGIRQARDGRRVEGGHGYGHLPRLAVEAEVALAKERRRPRGRAFGVEGRASLRLERREGLRQPSGLERQRREHRPHRLATHVGGRRTVGGEDRGQTGYDDPPDAERPGERRTEERAAAAVAHEREAARV